LNYIISVVESPNTGNYKFITVLPTIKIDQLDQKIEADEAPLLIAENVIEYFASTQEDEVLNKLIHKTRLGGELVVSVLNGKKILWALTENNFVDGNSKLYGSHKYPIRNICFDLPGFIKKLESKGLKIVQVLEQDGKNVFKCQKLQ
jgi:hypothetical protein